MPAPPILWSPTPTCGPRPESAPTSSGCGASEGSASPATTISCAGRPATSTPSGARSGTTSRSSRRPIRAGAGRRDDARRALVPDRAPELGRALPAPRGPARVGHGGRRSIADAGSDGADRGRAARRGRSRARRARAASGSAGATGSPATCRTSPRRSSRCLATASLGAIWTAAPRSSACDRSSTD